MAEKEPISVIADEATKKATALFFDPETFSAEALRTIVGYQIFSRKPREIIYKIGGTYIPVETNELISMRKIDEEKRGKFIEQVVEALKGPYTTEIMISDVG